MLFDVGGLEHFFGIYALFAQLLEFCYYLGTVLGIGYAEPLGGGVEDFAGGGAVLDEFVNHKGNEELALEVLHVLRVAEESFEILFAVLEVVGSKAPEVHRNGRGIGNSNPFAVVVEILHHTVKALNLCALHNGGKVVVFIVLANAAAYCTAFAQRIAHTETNHCVLTSATFGELAQLFAHHAEGVAIVEVVAVEHGEGFLDGALAHHDCVVSTPGLGALSRAGEAFGQSIEGLEYEFAGDVAFVLGEHDATEILLEILADNKDEFAEASVDSIVDGVIHNGFTVGAQGVQLLQTAITATHSCCEEKKCRFH